MTTPRSSHRPIFPRNEVSSREGHRRVAGLDEVGRGAWAGPVSVGVAVVVAANSEDSMPGGCGTRSSSVRRGASRSSSPWATGASSGRSATPLRRNAISGGCGWRCSLASQRALAGLETCTRCRPGRRATGSVASDRSEFGVGICAGRCGPLWVGTPGAPRSPPPRCWPRWCATASCGGSRSTSRPTDSSGTRAIPPRCTRWRSAATGCRPSIGEAGPTWPSLPWSDGCRSR